MKSILIPLIKDGYVQRMECAFGTPLPGHCKTDVFPKGFIHKEKIRVIYEDSNHDLYFFRTKALFLSLICL